MKIIKFLKYTALIILLMVSAFVSTIIPYQRVFYYFQPPVSEERLERIFVNRSTDEGMQAGKYIPVIKNINEIKNASYFTMDVDKLVPTDLYAIVDMSRGGYKEVGKGKNRKLKYMPFWTRDKTTLLVNDMEYARFYIATLLDGNRVIILIDDTLHDLKSGGKIKLPVGIIARYARVTRAQKTDTFFQYFSKNSDKYGLKDNNDWFVNMASKSFNNSYRLSIMIVRIISGIIIFAFLIFIGDLILKKIKRRNA
ncbi:hypothetical protein [Serratia fonticola]